MTSGMSGMTMREEPECIKKWKLEQEEMLKKKDADEEVNIVYMGRDWKKIIEDMGDKVLVDEEQKRSN